MRTVRAQVGMCRAPPVCAMLLLVHTSATAVPLASWFATAAHNHPQGRAVSARKNALMLTCTKANARGGIRPTCTPSAYRREKEKWRGSQGAKGVGPRPDTLSKGGPRPEKPCRPPRALRSDDGGCAYRTGSDGWHAGKSPALERVPLGPAHGLSRASKQKSPQHAAARRHDGPAPSQRRACPGAQRPSWAHAIIVKVAAAPARARCRATRRLGGAGLHISSRCWR